MPQSLPFDPFATKGLEYLLVVAFLVAFALYWRLLRRAPATAPLAFAARGAGAARWFELAEAPWYHPGHSWALPGDDGLVTLGIDDFAQRLLGRASALGLPAIGTRLGQGEVGWRIEVDAVPIELLSPVDGVVVASNEAALARPDLIHDDPYGAGWLLKVRPSRIRANLRGLLHGELARAWMAQTEEQLRRRVSGELGVVLQDGGLPVSGIARSLSAEQWDEIARDFLLTR